MVQHNKTQSELGYGLPQPTFTPAQSPIIAKRDPTSADIGYAVGQQWVNTLTTSFWALGANAGGVASWVTLGNLTSTYTTLTATTFRTATAATAITLGSGNVFTGVGSNAAVGFTFTPKGAGGLTLTTGDLTLSSGNAILTSGNLTLTSGNETITSGNLSLSSGYVDVTGGDVKIESAGKGLQIKEGANARMGQATLVAGTVTVSNTSVTANTRIFISRASPGGTPGALGTLCVGTVTPATSFVIHALDPSDGTSVIATDVSDVNWILIEKL